MFVVQIMFSDLEHVKIHVRCSDVILQLINTLKPYQLFIIVFFICAVQSWRLLGVAKHENYEVRRPYNLANLCVGLFPPSGLDGWPSKRTLPGGQGARHDNRVAGFKTVQHEWNCKEESKGCYPRWTQHVCPRTGKKVWTSVNLNPEWYFKHCRTSFLYQK